MMTQFVEGQRIILTTSGRDYGTFVAYGEPTENGEDTVLINVDGRYYNPQRHHASSVIEAIADRDMVAGDLLNTSMLKEVFEVPFLGTLWTHGDAGMLTPYVCECSFGDGQRLLKIATINQRPNYYVVRVHSGWSESNWSSDESVGDHIDDILASIEEECGPAGDYLDEPCERCAETCCKCSDDYSAHEQFPALDDRDGCSWAFIDHAEVMRKIGLK